MTEPTRDKGWLIPYLLDGDKLFTSGRWWWWLHAPYGVVPAGPIPQIQFVDPSNDAVPDEFVDFPMKQGRLSAYGAYRHVRRLLEKSSAPGWDGLRYFMEWMGWGLDVHDEWPSAEPVAGMEQLLYTEFQLSRLQAAHADIFGLLFTERIGSGKYNPNAFFPTPQTVSNMMAAMVMEDSTDKMSSVLDPCVGTGRMLLAASNYSVQLFGCDIDRMCVLACSLNAALFMPWMLVPKGEAMPEPTIEAVSEARVSWGHSPLPLSKKHKKDSKGRLLLFEFENE